MIDRETILNQIQKIKKQGYKSLVNNLAFDNKCSKVEILNIINDLLDEGEIVILNDKIFLSKESGFLRGTISASSRGFAFCELDDETMPDMFIAPKNLNGAFNNDIVLIKIIDKGTKEKSTEAEVVKVLKRGTTKVVGLLKKQKNFGFVIVDDAKFTKDVYIQKKNLSTAKDGEKVVVQILDFGDSRKKPEGKIIEVIGDPNKKGNDILSIIRTYNLYEEFPKNVIDEANKLPDKLSLKDEENRLDLKDELTVTIDGEDAKDFDDAVSLKINNDGTYHLGVHIADVGNYVKRNSEIDKEAFNRGTSVYFPDRVLPMLPTKLSNGICSLNPKQDRLTLSVIMDIDANGKVFNHKICESVINSNERMTYTDVYAVLEGDEKTTKKYAYLKDMFFKMAELHSILEKNRFERGALDFELPECYIMVDENGKTCDIKKRERNTAHKMIESFMLIANEVVAKDFYDKMIPFVYRIHEKPTEEKMQNFFNFIEVLGVKTSASATNVEPKDLQTIVDSTKNQPYAKTVNEVMLRSLQKAKYSPNCLGHYGLAAKFYCHFTSPIRRYPDLTIHRIIKDYLHNNIKGAKLEELKEFVCIASDQSSTREILAEKAEREVDDYKKAEYMQQFVGKEFDASITGITNNGIFVGLENTVEGMIRLENLPKDDYIYNENLFMLAGKQNKFMIGQDLKVRLKSVNLEERRIDFEYISRI
jgi:ribonuclease R